MVKYLKIAMKIRP